MSAIDRARALSKSYGGYPDPDPGVVLASSASRLTRMAVPPGVNHPLIPANPSRVAFVVMIPAAPNATYEISPDSQASLGGMPMSNEGETYVVNLFEFGPAVCAGWTIFSTFGGNITVMETLKAL